MILRLALLVLLSISAGCFNGPFARRIPDDAARFTVDVVEPQPFPVPVEELNLSRQEHEVLAEGLRRASSVGYWDHSTTFAESTAWQGAYDAAFAARYPSETLHDRILSFEGNHYRITVLVV